MAHQDNNPNRRETERAPKVLDYLDYRAFMDDYYQWRKRNQKGFTQRKFIQQAGLPESCSSLWPAVVKGRRNLSQSMRTRFARAMNLTDREFEHFELLVQFNQADSMEDKNFFFKKLGKFRRSRARLLQGTQYEFFSKWYYVAVWNYFGMHQNQNHPAAIAKALFPQVTVPQVKESIRLLLKLGLIHKTANGYAVSNDQHLVSEQDVKDLSAKQHILEMLEMAGEVFHRVPAKNRQYNSLTFTLSEKGFTAVKDRIRSFQEELREIIEQDSKEDRIYTLCMQLFPNSALPKN